MRSPGPALPLLGWLVLLTALACDRRVTARERLGSTADPYHLPPADTLDQATYDGWKQYRLLCDRCHGEDAQGTTFGPSLLTALRGDGTTPTREAFLALMLNGRPDKGMPAAPRLGLETRYFDGLYDYLSGRSSGKYFGGRPALRTQ